MKYPDRRSEFEFQAWIWSKLRAAGIDARGEVKHDADLRIRGCRFDIVLFKDRKAVRIIEVKPEMTVSIEEADQRSGDGDIFLPPRKYQGLGIPVDKVFGGEHRQYVDWVIENWNTSRSWYYARDLYSPLKRGDVAIT